MAKRRVRVEGVDEHVVVQKDHGSRVSSRSFSHVIVGRRGALCMACIHAFLLMRSARSGFSSLIEQETAFRLLLDVKNIPRPPARQDDPLFAINRRCTHGGSIPQGVSFISGRCRPL
ncbi:MAG: hypothetical protein JRI99_10340 [Deltaproteobacteria bacterium]|nr:hypothetical protein [Deltaproteobacteria bacterium]